MGKQRILIIEDNFDNQELVRLLVEQAGHETLTASGGLEGMALARQQQPDLILLDMGLPELDGFEVARQLKGSPETSRIPIIALTAYTLPGDRRRTLDAGCDGYLSKPLDVEAFAGELKRFLKD